MNAEKRKFFINGRLLAIFLSFLVFTICVALFFQNWNVFSADFHFLINSSKTPADYDAPMLIRLGFLLIWGLSIFTFACSYIDAKFRGLFNRMATSFEDMQKDDSISLRLRKGDPFTPIEESFEHMKATLLSRVETRQELLRDIAEVIENPPANPSAEQFRELLEKIDRELTS